MAKRPMIRTEKRKESSVSCVLMLSREQAQALVDLLELERTNDEPYRYDKTPLGKVLEALKSGGRTG